ncbi:pseudouridine synthase [Crenobacter cavernae]|uniref:Pseudouridine synthase n=1 Tax=Crenobacter cavernae TaxID=2290923 RepID=A0A345Y6Q8_9NEIS|nr:pseudouridine synthase [Crenobacter cavernae]AXK39610.1 pseudouridine synthase [Crenobacter cavernae]
MKKRLLQIAIAVDQLLNAATPGGWADETLSSRAWRLRNRRGWGAARRAIDTLFFWQRAHCRKAFESELLRRHLPPEYRPGTLSRL